MLSKRNTRKRAKIHGFLNRSASVLKRRRNKGRHRLTASVHSK